MSSVRNAKRGSGPVKGLLRKLMPFAVSILLFSIFVNLLRLTVPLYMLQVIDRVMSSESTETLVSISIIAVMALIASAILSHVSAQVQMTAGAWLEESLFGKVAKTTLDRGGTNTKEPAERLARELSKLRQFFSSPTLMTLLEVPWSVFFVAILFWLHFYLGAVASVAICVLFAVSIVGELLAQPHMRGGQSEKEQGIKSLAVAAEASDALRAMGATDRLVANLNKSNTSGSETLAKGMRWTILVQQVTKFLRTCAQISILGVGALLVLQQEITTGTMIAGSILLGLILSPVDKAVSSFRSIRSARDSIDILDSRLAQSNDTEKFDIGASGEGVSVSLRQAMFMPQGSRKPVMRPLSVEFQPGTCIGILGPVGAGKSTLCRMLVGAISPTSGSVRINDVETAQLIGSGFGSRVGYLPQDEPLFPGSIEENISRFDDVSRTEVKLAVTEAARAAGVNETILGLKNQYETRIGATGIAHLSYGQMQQIRIARTFYGDPSLIVMDEPAVSLDKSSEECLADAVAKAKKRGATIFLVSQRQNLLSMCDTLLYLRDGTLVTVGAREQVLKQIAEGNLSPGPRRIADYKGDRQPSKGASS